MFEWSRRLPICTGLEDRLRQEYPVSHLGAAAHGEHEKCIGAADANWPDWYAEYIVREQTGEELPQMNEYEAVNGGVAASIRCR